MIAHAGGSNDAAMRTEGLIPNISGISIGLVDTAEKSILLRILINSCVIVSETLVDDEVVVAY